MEVTVECMSDLQVSTSTLTAEERDFFEENGYVICRNLVESDVCSLMLDVVKTDVEHKREPFEYEADVHYPGAPEARSSQGGMTIRRLKLAHSRDPVFHNWLTSAPLLNRLRTLLGPQLVCPLGHHNCVMTKEPRFSSDTGWHQDIRYWAFSNTNLVSAWLALGTENEKNGCLRVIPGSHRMTFQPDQFDQEKFFRADHPVNKQLISHAKFVEMKQGDVLLFHALTLHAASRNYTDQTKYAAVFTFRALQNQPVPGTRSAANGELLLPNE
jgi:phytanoyl-CoA hydroxylase